MESTHSIDTDEQQLPDDNLEYTEYPVADITLQSSTKAGNYVLKSFK